jgi:acyl-CoA thioesterase FadM
MDVKRVETLLEEALETAKQVQHSEMLQYLIQMALREAQVDYYRQLPMGHPDRHPPAS